MYDHILSTCELERIIYALEGGEAQCWERSSAGLVESVRHRRDFPRRDGDVLCVEAAFWIGVAVGIHVVADREPLDARADCYDGSHAVDAQD